MEFKTLVIRMTSELRGRIVKSREKLNKRHKKGSKKCKNQPVRNEEYKNEMKNMRGGLTSRLGG